MYSPFRDPLPWLIHDVDSVGIVRETHGRQVRGVGDEFMRRRHLFPEAGRRVRRRPSGDGEPIYKRAIQMVGGGASHPS